MKSCAYCGRENQDDATHCHECGTADFVVAVPSSAPSQQKLERITEAAEPQCDVPPDGEAALCTACLFPNLPESRWCKRCDAPMSSITMFLMPDAARAAGFVYRRAVEARPKLVVVCWIWMHFFPGLVLNALALLAILGGGVGGLRGLAGFILAIVGGTVCASMLYRVTRNYFTMQRAESDAAAA